MSRAERRAQNAIYESEMREDMNRRQEAPRPPSLPPSDPHYCTSNMKGGNRHSFGMRGSDGIFRCWHCCKRKVSA